MFDRGAVLGRPLAFLRLSVPLLTAHHPFCDAFSGHTFTFLGRKWCIGCFFSSIAFFSTLPALLFLWSGQYLSLTRDMFYLTAALAVGGSFLMSATGATEHRGVKAVAKVLLGAGFASLVAGVLVSGGDIGYYLVGKLVVIVILYLPVITLMNVRRYREIESVCGTCEHRMRWSTCPGFGDLVCAYFTAGFLRLTDDVPQLDD